MKVRLHRGIVVGAVVMVVVVVIVLVIVLVVVIAAVRVGGSHTTGRLVFSVSFSAQSRMDRIFVTRS